MVLKMYHLLVIMVILHNRGVFLKKEKLNLLRVIITIIETLVVNAIVYLLFYMLKANQEVYINLNPHPLIFFSAFMGLRYGKKLGLLSAVITSYIYILVFVSLNYELSFFFQYFSNFKNPLICLWIALILGIFRDNHLYNTAKLKDENKTLKEEYLKLEKDFHVIDRVQKELKNQIIGSNESIISLYDIASKLETFEIEDIFTEIIGVLKKYLKVTSASIYYYDEVNQFLRLKIKYGENIIDRSSFAIDEFPCYESAIKSRTVVKWKKGDSKKQPLMVAPIIKNNKIIAFINIENMEFDVLSEYAYRLFTLITDWVNKALSKAHFIDEISEKKYIDNTLFAVPEYFNKRVAVEEDRRIKFSMEYGLLKLKNESFRIEELNSIVSRSLRIVDIASYDVETKILSILLPATKLKDMHIIEERFLTHFEYKLSKID